MQVLLYDKLVGLMSWVDPVKSMVAFGFMHLLVVWVWLFDVKLWALIWVLHLLVVLKPIYYSKLVPLA